MSKTKNGIVLHLAKALGTQGLRLKLLRSNIGQQHFTLVDKINVITNNFEPSTEEARLLACRCIAAALDARGEISNHSPNQWDLGSSAKDLNSEQVLQRLSRIVSMPFEQAQDHIYGLVRLLISKDVPINYNRLYWDLINMQLKQKNIAHTWVTSYVTL